MNIRQLLPIITAIFIAIIVALSIYSINQSTEISTLIERNDENEQLSLEFQNFASLQFELDDANKELDELKSQIQNLLKQIETLSLSNEQRHLDLSIMAILDCSGCHSEIIELALVGESNNYHNIHLNNILLNFNCVDCHKSVNILSKSTDITRVIDIGICVSCHSSFPDHVYTHASPSKEAFARMFFYCDRCHDNWKEEMKEATFVNLEVITRDDCTTCHLDNLKFVIKQSPIQIPCSKCH